MLFYHPFYCYRKVVVAGEEETVVGKDCFENSVDCLCFLEVEVG